MDYDRGAMSRMIDRLESKELISRVALAHTRRTMSLEVTEAGKAAFPKMQACLDQGGESIAEGRHQGPGSRSGEDLETNAGE